MNVVAPGFFKAMNQQISSSSLDALKSYLRWHTVHRYAANLSDAFVQENFRFYAATLAGQQELAPRWKRCTGIGPDQRPRFRDPHGRWIAEVPELPRVADLGWL